MSLHSVLDGLTEPVGTGYHVAPVPNFSEYRIGRGSDGAVVLLTPPDPDPDPPTRLRMIKLDPRVRCRLVDPAGVTSEEDRGLVEFRPEDEQMLGPFLEVAGALVRLLGPEPARGEISRGMQMLVRLFEQDRSPTGSVLGLWGELLFILLHDNPAYMVDAWHAAVDDRFDFAAEGTRVEVKTTTRPERIHKFGLSQLLPTAGTPTIIISIMTTETQLGTSLYDLIERLEGRLAGQADRQVKVHLQVAATLGSDWMNSVSTRYDEHQASASLARFDAETVPRVEPGPAEVLNVELTVDCGAVPHLVSAD